MRTVLALALEGWSSLDISNFLAAPLCSMFLSDFGAEVDQVSEQPGRGERSV